MMTKIFLSIAYIACATAFTATAQTAKTDFEKVRQTYAVLKGISANMEYIVFRGHDGTQAISTSYGSYKSDMGSSFLYKLEGFTQLHNPSYDISVLGEDKVITLAHSKLKSASPLYGVDTSGANWRSAVKIGEANGIRTWRVTYKDPTSEFERMDVTIDIGRWLVKSISLFYRTKMGTYLASDEKADDYLPKLTINYRDVVLNPTFAADEFSEKKFIRVATNGKQEPAPGYQNYELIFLNQ